MDKQELGKKGEELGAQYLIGKGYQILATNWQSGHQEVDIIARKNDLICFVEVKTRATDKFEAPYKAVNKQKQSYLIQAAQRYIDAMDEDVEAQFDVLSIVLNSFKQEIEHIEEAFRAY